jgi:hypothetical protein
VPTISFSVISTRWECDTRFAREHLGAPAELKKLTGQAQRAEMRLLTKAEPATWWNGTEALPPSNLDHVVAAQHLEFEAFSGADVTVSGMAQASRSRSTEVDCVPLWSRSSVLRSATRLNQRGRRTRSMARSRVIEMDAVPHGKTNGLTSHVAVIQEAETRAAKLPFRHWSTNV